MEGGVECFSIIPVSIGFCVHIFHSTEHLAGINVGEVTQDGR